MIAYKIDNCDSIENKFFLEKIKEELKTGKYVLEFGLECYNPRHINLKSSLLQEIKNINCQKICHLSLNNKIFNLSEKSEEQWLSEINEELKIAKDLNASWNIIHATNKESKRYITNQLMQDHKILFDTLKHNSSLLAGNNILIENTYEDLAFQEELFSHLDKRIGFVLDIGHVKVHSKVANKDWIRFVEELDKEGRQLHFHIHDNDGTYDQHELLRFNPTQQSKFFIDLYERFGSRFTFTFEQHGITEFEVLKNNINRYEDFFKRKFNL